MRRVSVYRPPVGVALLECGKDKGVVFVDLQIAGARVLANVDPAKYLKQFETVQSTLEALGLPTFMPSKEEKLVLRFKRRVVLAVLMYSEYPIVRNVVLAAFAPGVLVKLVKKLEANGWRRVTLLELKPSRSAAHRYSAFRPST